MKSLTVKQIQKELSKASHNELINLCLTLAKFKKENKEFLTYLLLESESESNFIASVKLEADELFNSINTNSYFYIKKSVRKILRLLKKYIRFSKKTETEVELLLYFCQKLAQFNPPISGNNALKSIFNREIRLIQLKLLLLHEDLQYDYNLELKNLIN